MLFLNNLRHDLYFFVTFFVLKKQNKTKKLVYSTTCNQHATKNSKKTAKVRFFDICWTFFLKKCWFYVVSWSIGLWLFVNYVNIFLPILRGLPTPCNIFVTFWLWWPTPPTYTSLWRVSRIVNKIKLNIC